jgi:hypothetical protein
MWEHEPVDRILFMVTDNSIPEVRTFDTLEDAVKFYNDTPGGD